MTYDNDSYFISFEDLSTICSSASSYVPLYFNNNSNKDFIKMKEKYTDKIYKLKISDKKLSYIFSQNNDFFIDNYVTNFGGIYNHLFHIIIVCIIFCLIITILLKISFKTNTKIYHKDSLKMHTIKIIIYYVLFIIFIAIITIDSLKFKTFINDEPFNGCACALFMLFLSLKNGEYDIILEKDNYKLEKSCVYNKWQGFQYAKSRMIQLENDIYEKFFIHILFNINKYKDIHSKLKYLSDNILLKKEEYYFEINQNNTSNNITNILIYELLNDNIIIKEINKNISKYIYINNNNNINEIEKSLKHIYNFILLKNDNLYTKINNMFDLMNETISELIDFIPSNYYHKILNKFSPKEQYFILIMNFLLLTLEVIMLITVFFCKILINFRKKNKKLNIISNNIYYFLAFLCIFAMIVDSFIEYHIDKLAIFSNMDRDIIAGVMNLVKPDNLIRNFPHIFPKNSNLTPIYTNIIINEKGNFTSYFGINNYTSDNIISKIYENMHIKNDNINNNDNELYIDIFKLDKIITNVKQYINGYLNYDDKFVTTEKLNGKKYIIVSDILSLINNHTIYKNGTTQYDLCSSDDILNNKGFNDFYYTIGYNNFINNNNYSLDGYCFYPKKFLPDSNINNNILLDINEFEYHDFKKRYKENKKCPNDNLTEIFTSIKLFTTIKNLNYNSINKLYNNLNKIKEYYLNITKLTNEINEKYVEVINGLIDEIKYLCYHNELYEFININVYDKYIDLTRITLYISSSRNITMFSFQISSIIMLFVLYLLYIILIVIKKPHPKISEKNLDNSEHSKKSNIKNDKNNALFISEDLSGLDKSNNIMLGFDKNEKDDINKEFEKSRSRNGSFIKCDILAINNFEKGNIKKEYLEFKSKDNSDLMIKNKKKRLKKYKSNMTYNNRFNYNKPSPQKSKDGKVMNGYEFSNDFLLTSSIGFFNIPKLRELQEKTEKNKTNYDNKSKINENNKEELVEENNNIEKVKFDNDISNFCNVTEKEDNNNNKSHIFTERKDIEKILSKKNSRFMTSLTNFSVNKEMLQMGVGRIFEDKYELNEIEESINGGNLKFLKNKIKFISKSPNIRDVRVKRSISKGLEKERKISEK